MSSPPLLDCYPLASSNCTGTPSSRYPPLFMIPGASLSTTSHLVNLPTSSDGWDRPGFAPVGWVCWQAACSFRCIFSLLFSRFHVGYDTDSSLPSFQHTYRSGSTGIARHSPPPPPIAPMSNPLQISLREHPKSTYNTPSHPSLNFRMNHALKSLGIDGFPLPQPG